MRNKFPIFVLAGLVSGYISGLTFGSFSIFGPGIFFGIATAPLFFWAFRAGFVKSLLWAVASTGAWYAAVNLYIALASPGAAAGASGGLGVDGTISLVLAGLCGAILLAISFWVLVRRVSLLRLGGVIVAGGVLAFGMSLLLYQQPNAGANYPAAFALWQAGIAAALTFRLAEATKS